jgi:hypothetical protein
MKKFTALLAFCLWAMTTEFAWGQVASRDFGTQESDYIQIDPGTDYDGIQGNDFTACVWFKPVTGSGTSADRWGLFERNTGSGSYEFYARILADLGTNGRLQFNQGCNTQNGQVVIEFASDISGEWHHLCGVLSGGTPNIYLDGVDATEFSNQDCTGTAKSTSGSDICIGQMDSTAVCSSGTDDEGGQLAYFELFSKALSGGEVASVMYCPGSVTDGLVGYWPLTDSGTQYDQSVNSNNGTNSGTAASTDGPPISTNCAGAGGN